MPLGMWDLSSLIRDWTHVPCKFYTSGPPGKPWWIFLSSAFCDSKVTTLMNILPSFFLTYKYLWWTCLSLRICVDEPSHTLSHHHFGMQLLGPSYWVKSNQSICCPVTSALLAEAIRVSLGDKHDREDRTRAHEPDCPSPTPGSTTYWLCKTWGSLHLTVPQFPQLSNGENNTTHYLGLLWILNYEILHVLRTYNKHSVNISYSYSIYYYYYY